jgi:hypothetical protein
LTDLPALGVLQLLAALVAVIAAWAAAQISHHSAAWILVGAGASGNVLARRCSDRLVGSAAS